MFSLQRKNGKDPETSPAAQHSPARKKYPYIHGPALLTEGEAEALAPLPRLSLFWEGVSFQGRFKKEKGDTSITHLFP